MQGVKKDSTNPFFKSKYADLEACQQELREHLKEHNLAVVQTSRVTESGLAVLVTTLFHESGQWIKGELPIVYNKANDAQAQGASMTYARRYGLCAITGLYQTDDDGESTKEREPAKPKQTPQQQVAAKRNEYNKAAETVNNYKGKPLPQQPPLQRPAKEVVEGEEPEPSKPMFEPLPKEKQVTKEMMAELMAVAKANNWTGPQVQKWILATYDLEESTIQYTFTREYWEATKKWVAERKPEES